MSPSDAAVKRPAPRAESDSIEEPLREEVADRQQQKKLDEAEAKRKRKAKRAEARRQRKEARERDGPVADKGRRKHTEIRQHRTSLDTQGEPTSSEDVDEVKKRKKAARQEASQRKKEHEDAISLTMTETVQTKTVSTREDSPPPPPLISRRGVTFDTLPSAKYDSDSSNDSSSSRMSFRRKLVNDEERRHHVLSREFFRKFSGFMGDWSLFFFLSLASMVGWSCLCAWGADKLESNAQENPGGTAERWLEWIDNTSVVIGVIGTLFTFSLVFRFNICYQRWWEGRILWGDLIHATLDLDQMNRSWIFDTQIADRLSRWIVVLIYACKAQLRGDSIHDPNEDGLKLIYRGLLTDVELLDMKQNPCWQPLYALDMIRAIVVKAYTTEDALCFDVNHKAYAQFIRCFDNAVVKISLLVGGTIRVRASGLPKSYDSIHHLFLYCYFFLAPISWAPSMGWALPFLVGFAAAIILTLISMGTAMVDPFGDDIVDLPLDRFCQTVEAQSREIRSRAFRMKRLDFAGSSSTRLKPLMGLDMMRTKPLHQINLGG